AADRPVGDLAPHRRPESALAGTVQPQALVRGSFGGSEDRLGQDEGSGDQDGADLECTCIFGTIEGHSPKAEIRKPKAEGNPNPEAPNPKLEPMGRTDTQSA